MVLVSHEHEFVFLKTSKTAGTSVEMLLEPFCTPPGHIVTEKTETLVSEYGVVGRRLIKRKKPIFRFRQSDLWINHMSAQRVAKYLGRKKWDRYQKITSVRNPFDQTVSRFYWRKRKSPIIDAPIEERKLAFSKFIKRKKLSTDSAIAFVRKEYVIDHIIRFENLRSDLETVASKLGIELDMKQLPHAKSQASLRRAQDIQAFFGPEETEILVEKMDWVFDRYGYSRDPKDAQA